MVRYFTLFLILVSLALPPISIAAAEETGLAQASSVVLDGSDAIKRNLQARQGKVVTVTLKSGSEIGGIVASVGSSVLHLKELSGNEYYDAIISLDSIEAMTFRSKNG